MSLSINLHASQLQQKRTEKCKGRHLNILDFLLNALYKQFKQQQICIFLKKEKEKEKKEKERREENNQKQKLNINQRAAPIQHSKNETNCPGDRFCKVFVSTNREYKRRI